MAINLKVGECAVCENEFSTSSRSFVCSKKECVEIANTLNLRTKLRNKIIKIRTLKDLWYFNQVKLNMLNFQDADTFEKRLEALKVYGKSASIKEIAKDTQILMNNLNSKRL